VAPSVLMVCAKCQLEQGHSCVGGRECEMIA
jgi:hypothetical protein